MEGTTLNVQRHKNSGHLYTDCPLRGGDSSGAPGNIGLDTPYIRGPGYYGRMCRRSDGSSFLCLPSLIFGETSVRWFLIMTPRSNILIAKDLEKIAIWVVAVVGLEGNFGISNLHV